MGNLLQWIKRLLIDKKPIKDEFDKKFYSLCKSGVVSKKSYNNAKRLYSLYGHQLSQSFS